MSYDVHVAFCVQEELGCRGVSAAAFGACPAGAIAVDVSFAAAREKNGKSAASWAEGL